MKRPTLLSFRFVRTNDEGRNKYFVFDEAADGGYVQREVFSTSDIEEYIISCNKKCG